MILRRARILMTKPLKETNRNRITMGLRFRGKFTLFIIVAEILMLIGFGFFVRYNPNVGLPKDLSTKMALHATTSYPKNLSNVTAEVTNENNHEISEDAEAHVEHYYSMFQDIHIMMFVGFGFLMTFLKRYGFSSVGLNFLVAAFVLQWQTLVHGWIRQRVDGRNTFIEVNVETLIEADFAAATVLISFGAVLGKVSALQLIVMAAFEVVLYEINELIVFDLLKATDVGDSMVVHLFGAYFGLMVAWILYKRDVKEAEDNEGSVYQSDIFAMIGTIFLWICWPSFNAATASDEGRVRAIVNTYYSLTASVIASFALSSLVDKKDRFNMVHVQNSTLAGGVAVGSIADMIINPWGAILIGMVSGSVSVLGYHFLTPCLSKRLRLHDTCGVHNLHGMPGVISGLGSILAAGIATPALYKDGLTKIFANDNTNVATQAAMQAACFGISLGVAVVGGILTGLILLLPIWDQPRHDEIFDDERNWVIPFDESNTPAYPTRKNEDFSRV